MYLYKAKLDRVIDGDTIDFILDLGFYIEKKVRIRVRDYDAPEIRGAEKEDGLIAKDRAVKLLSEAETIIVATDKDRSFDRWIGDILLDGVDYKEAMNVS